MWPSRAVIELFGIDVPIIQAPMAGACGSALAQAVSAAGALGSLPCAMLDVGTATAEIAAIRANSNGPLNLNFFCHQENVITAADETRWLEALKPFYEDLGIDTRSPGSGARRAPFDETTVELVENASPEVVSFHFGLPAEPLLDRVRSTGAKILSSATTVAEAIWLAERGVDAIIAQGAEAGGHRGVFLGSAIENQPGTMALVPQVVDAVDVPVIAAGGIADGRGIAAALALGADGVQIGTAYLFTPEATISSKHREALEQATADSTALTNLFSGRPARGLVNRLMREIGPISESAPPFPHAGNALAPLKARAEAEGRTDFTSLWSGQGVGLGRGMNASELTLALADEALERLSHLAPR